MPRPNYTKHSWCNICEVENPLGALTCKLCGYRVRNKARTKKKDSMVKRIE